MVAQEITNLSPGKLLELSTSHKKKSGDIDEESFGGKMQNKLTSACNPRANGMSVLANQNAHFCKALL